MSCTIKCQKCNSCITYHTIDMDIIKKDICGSFCFICDKFSCMVCTIKEGKMGSPNYNCGCLNFSIASPHQSGKTSEVSQFLKGEEIESESEKTYNDRFDTIIRQCFKCKKDCERKQLKKEYHTGRRSDDAEFNSGEFCDADDCDKFYCFDCCKTFDIFDMKKNKIRKWCFDDLFHCCNDPYMPTSFKTCFECNISIPAYRNYERNYDYGNYEECEYDDCKKLYCNDCAGKKILYETYSNDVNSFNGYKEVMYRECHEYDGNETFYCCSKRHYCDKCLSGFEVGKSFEVNRNYCCENKK